MVDFRKNDRLFILVAAILMIVTVFIPMTIFIEDLRGDAGILWMVAVGISIDDFAFNSIYNYKPGFIIAGSFFAVLLLALGIFLIITANLQKKGKNIKFQEYILLIIGLFLLIMPYLFRSVIGLVSTIAATDKVIYYGGSFYTIEILIPIAAVCLLVPAALKISK